MSGGHTENPIENIVRQFTQGLGLQQPSERPELLVLVRHAESKRNRAKQGATYFADEYARRDVKGIPDHKVALTRRGIMQAQETGHALREKFGTFDYAYHSGFLRTEDTLNKILEAYTTEEQDAIKKRMNAFISERHPGFAYDMTEEEAEKHFPFLQEYWDTFGGFFATPIGGESLFMVTLRVYLFLNMLFRDRVGKKVLVVTHGGTLRCFRFLLEHWDYNQAVSWPEGESPKNCGVTYYERTRNDTGDHLILRGYNTTYWK